MFCLYFRIKRMRFFSIVSCRLLYFTGSDWLSGVFFVEERELYIFHEIEELGQNPFVVSLGTMVNRGAMGWKRKSHFVLCYYIRCIISNRPNVAHGAVDDLQ